MTNIYRNFHKVKNVQTAGIHAGFKVDDNLKDFGLIYFPEGVTVAGVFTKNRVSAWPVQYDQKRVAESSNFKAILINSGNANACNGEIGKKAVTDSVKILADKLNIKESEVLVSSTGVIGADFVMSDKDAEISQLVDSLQSESVEDLAHAIMTTDTKPKVATKEVEIGGHTINISAIAKGSGMINPNLGTMLAFIVTDCNLDQSTAQSILQKAADKSFNCLTVDGDTSTNDTVLLAATGEKDFEQNDDNLALIESAITDICQSLAKMMAKDGEGASKFITIEITGADSDEDAYEVAKAIANSNLVKTAFFGNDPNFGRIISAVGYSNAKVIDPNSISLAFKSNYGEIILAENGQAVKHSREEAINIMKETDITVKVDLGIKNGKATVWTSDLSYDYVKINAEYTS